MNMRAVRRHGHFGRDFLSSFAGGARNGWRGKRKGIALFERENVAFGLGATGTDLQQIEFENGNGIRNKFGERAVHVRGERGVHGVVKDVRHFRGYLGKKRKAVAGGSAG